jgi:hypothetical protein
VFAVAQTVDSKTMSLQYLDALKANLFLSANEADVMSAVVSDRTAGSGSGP